MSWQCKLLDIVGLKFVQLEPTPTCNIVGETRLVDSEGKEYSFKQLPIGTMFYLPKDADMKEWPWYLAKQNRISDYYFQHNSHRQPLFVVLPGHTLFVVDGKCYSGEEMYGGWTVTGEAPNITVNPSIDITGFYHGFLANGVISDDVEGRKFPV